MSNECDKDCKYNDKDEECSYGNSSLYADDNASDCPLTSDSDSKSEKDDKMFLL